MANTYTWKINPKGLITISELDNKVDVVKNIAFTIEGTDGINTVEFPDSVNLKYDPNSPFIEFNALTEAKIIEWVKESNPKRTEEMLKTVDNLLQNKINLGPVASAKKAPWIK